MPRENKKRGRRAEATKRKHDEEQDAAQGQSPQKKVKTDDAPTHLDHTTVNEYAEGYNEGEEGGEDRPFYGLLDEQEQEYFRRAGDMLEANQFSEPEERTLFLSSVFKEAEGKELKMACSQSCSRLLERLILSAAPDQLKSLFQKFNGHFLNLVQHRFASHCCETLFLQCAPIVSSESAKPGKSNGVSHEDSEPYVSMEDLFLNVLKELEGNLGYLLTDRFGSHVLRVLLVIFSGQSLDQTSKRSLMQSKRKEHVEVTGMDSKVAKDNFQKRAVPQSFTAALETMMHESVVGLDTSYLRTLATHPIGNPILQLLLQLDLGHFGKQHAKDEASIMRKLLPDESLVEGTEGARFINGIVFDTVGSRLLETIIEDAPGKLFKCLYRDYFKDRIGSLARNEVAGYVAGKVLERLSKEDLQKACDGIMAQIPNLAERGRTAIIKTLAERCIVRGVDTKPLVTALQQTYTDDEGATFSILRLLNVPSPVEPNVEVSPKPSVGSVEAANIPTLPPPQIQSSDLPPMDSTETTQTSLSTTPATLHASLLAQTMLSHPGPLATMVFDAVTKLPPNLLMSFARTTVLSPILQKALKVKHAPVMFRRKLIKTFYSHMFKLAIDMSGSHLVDAFWDGTSGMAFVRERIAEELAENESALRESPYGRKVWKNWGMDIYKRRRGDWVKKAREVGNDGFVSFPDGHENMENGDTAKTKVKTLTSGEERAVENNGGKSSVRRNESGPNGTVPKGRKSHNKNSSGPTGTNSYGKPKTKLDLAREKFTKSQKHAQGQGQHQGQGRHGHAHNANLEPLGH